MEEYQKILNMYQSLSLRGGEKFMISLEDHTILSSK